MRPKNLVFAQRSRRCKVCGLAPAIIADVNAAIWPEPGIKLRGPQYRARAQRVCTANGLDVDVKTITHHADHTERSWHTVTGTTKPGPGEIPVFPHAFGDLVDSASKVGAFALTEIGKRIPDMDSRDLIGVAKLGVGASATRESLRLKAQEVDQTQAIVAALTGLASGHITEGDIPEAEVINVTPPEVLLAQVRTERAALERRQAGEDGGPR